jgi:hypothetical protein
MLGDGVQDSVRDRYRDAVVAPRRSRIRACLRSAVDQGLLDPGADLVVASSFLTGSWYAMALAGTVPPRDWARRVATLVWGACGGRRPDAPASSRP